MPVDSQMHYLVKGEFIEEILAGKTPEESAMYSQQVIKPSLEALWKHAEDKKIVGGTIAGAREAAFIIDVDSNAEVGRLLEEPSFLGGDEVDRLSPPVVPVGGRPGQRSHPGDARNGRRKLGPVEPTLARSAWGRSATSAPGARF